MFVLIWAILLLPVGGVARGTLCVNGHCVTLNDGEITAETGLCVVIPCSFSTVFLFTTKSIVWFKCEASKPRCEDSAPIFHSKNNKNVEPGFRGRVSLLEPDVSRKNCSIIINDLTESDSGLYQLRLNGEVLQTAAGITFPKMANVSVKDLIQRPAVMSPPLTEGQQATLTCTAPGLCSGSDPRITWTWRGRERNDSRIQRYIISAQTVSLTAVAQRRSSTLTFEASAKHHGTEVTCKVHYTNNVTAEETVTLYVALFPKILKKSECEVQSKVLTCVCISEGFPLPTITWPLLKDQSTYSVVTTVSKQRVGGTITVKDRGDAAVECVSSSEAGEARRNITVIKTSSRREDKLESGTSLPWAVAAASLIMNVICIICILVLWNSRKKVKPNQEDRTYMALQKTDPDYDVIGQPLT